MEKETGATFVGHAPEFVEQVFQPAKGFVTEIQDLKTRCLVLSNDVAICSKHLNKRPNDQFWRRNMVKSLFVLFEACSYGLKRIALHLHNHCVIPVSV